MSDRPKLTMAAADLNVDQRLVFLYDQLKKLKVTVPTATVTTGSSSVADELSEMKWRGAITTRSYASVVVLGTVQPWSWVNGALNTNFQFGNNSGISPVVVDSGLVPGDLVTVKYLSGTVNVNGGFGNSDAGGAVGNGPTGGNLGSTGKLFPTAYMPALAVLGVNGPTGSPFSSASPAAYLGIGGLAAAFTDDGAALVSAFAPGNGGTFIVPSRATTLQLGIDDDLHSDNTGSYTISVTITSGALPSYVVGDVVVFGGLPYVCVVGNPNGILPPSTLYWVLLNTTTGSGIGVGSVVFSTAASPATLNVSTQGTKDWFVLGGSLANPPRASSGFSLHAKRLGGWIKGSFDWISGTTSVISLVTGGAAGIAITSSATDDMAPAITALNPSISVIRSGSGTPLNFGYRFEVPADSTSRTLNLNWAVNSVKVTLTCRMSDGSLADQTTTLDAGSSGTFVQQQLTIVYKSGSPNAKMFVDVAVTTNYGGSFQDVAFIAATLA